MGKTPTHSQKGTQWSGPIFGKGIAKMFIDHCGVSKSKGDNKLGYPLQHQHQAPKPEDEDNYGADAVWNETTIQSNADIVDNIILEWLILMPCGIGFDWEITKSAMLGNQRDFWLFLWKSKWICWLNYVNLLKNNIR